MIFLLCKSPKTRQYKISLDCAKACFMIQFSVQHSILCLCLNFNVARTTVHKQTVFWNSQYLFAAGKTPVSVRLTLTALVATQKNHSHQWSALVTDISSRPALRVSIYESFHCYVISIFFLHFNPLGTKSDQHQFSPNNISRTSRVKVMRITKLITKGRIL